MSTRHALALLCLLALADLANGAEQVFKSKFREDQAGYWLEREFIKLQDRCSGVLGNKRIKVSPLPPHLLAGTRPALSTPVHPIDQVNVSTLFNYVWPENAVSKLEVHNPDRLIRRLPAILQVGIRPEPNVSSFEYTQNCTGCALLNAAAGGGASVINLKAALDAETSSNDELSVLYGTFYSPLKQVLDSPNPTSRLAGILAIWDVYARGSNAIDQPAGYYVTGFTGTVVASGRREERSIAGSAKSALGVALPLFNVNATGEYEYSRQARTRINDFMILAERTPGEGTLKASLQELPSPEALARDFGELPMEVENVTRQWSKDADHVIELRIRGLPQYARDAGNWVLDLDDDDSTLVGCSGLRTTPDSDRDAQLETAFPLRFTVTPRRNLFMDDVVAKGTFELNGQLVYRDVVESPRTRLARRFSVTANLAEAYVPTVPHSATTEIAAYDDSMKVVWKFEFGFDDAKDIDLSKPLRLRSLGVPCKEVGAERVTPEVPYDPAKRSFRVTMELLLGPRTKYGVGPSDFVTCSSMFEVTFTLKGSNTPPRELTRALQVGLGLPRWR